MLNTVSAVMSAIRSIFIVLDSGIYWLLKFSYELFFNIATFNLIDRKIIFELISRIQLVVGVFMLFQLVMIIMKGIVNPDSVTDSKSGGAGAIVMRIVVSIALLALIVPINIPSPKNEYEKQVNNNGILFGTLYSLQYRILANNTIGKIIMNDSPNYTSNDPDNEELTEFANRFTSTVVKTFYTLNVEEDEATGETKYVCDDGYDEEYASETDPFKIITQGTKSCGGNAAADATLPGSIMNTGKQYSLSMSYFISTICAGVLLILMFLITFDVAKRVFQLTALQLIAPVPIISYMDPKGSKDGAFSSWVKLLGTTYLDLFIRIAVIYFAFFVLQSYMNTYQLGTEASVESAMGLISDQQSGFVAGPLLVKWTFIIMSIALFMFAKDAPKFFRQMLGIKSEKKFFDAFGQALGVGAVAAGAVSGAISGGVAKYQNTPATDKNRVGKSILAGISGAANTTMSSGKQFLNSKDGAAAAIMDNNRKLALQNYTNAADDSTFGGRILAGAQANLGFQNRLQQMDDMIKYYTAAKDAMGRMNDAFNSNGDFKYQFRGKARKDANGNIMRNANGQVIGDMIDIVDSHGNKVLDVTKSYSLKDYNDILARVQASGDAKLIEAVDAAKKLAQSERLSEIRVEFNEADRAVARKRLIAEIERCAKLDKTDADYHKWTQRDLDVFDGAYSIYNVAKKYEDEAIFAEFKGERFDSNELSWAVFKTAASAAGDTGKSMKASPEYDQASANAKRAAEAAKKK